MKVVKWT